MDLDESILHEMCDGDLEFETELLQTFLNCQETAMDELALAADHRDLEAIKTVAHFTKGGARSIGGAKLAQLSETLEFAASQGDSDLVLSLVAQAQLAFDSLRQIIQSR